jgi:hypothetical protein
MKKQTNRPRLVLSRETIAPMLLDRVNGGGPIAEITTISPATTSVTVMATRWCPKPKK